MPLLVSTLADKLINLDEAPSVPLDNIPATAQAWADAWWEYASGMVYLNSGTLTVSKLFAVPAFMGVIMSGLTPGPAPIPFFLALEGAMRAGWGALSTPVSLIPPVISITPAPAPFAPLGAAIVPVGMAASSKVAVRTMLAGIIHGWTLSHITVAAPPVGSLGPIL